MFKINGVIVNTGDGEDSIRLDWYKGKKVLHHYVKGKLEQRVYVPSHMTGVQALQIADAELFVKKNKRK
jgi:hypothetical protein